MIKFYSSHCPMCKQIKMQLDKLGVEYEEISDENKYLSIAENTNIKSMPFAEVEGKILNSQDLIKWINAKREETK